MTTDERNKKKRRDTIAKEVLLAMLTGKLGAFVNSVGKIDEQAVKNRIEDAYLIADCLMKREQEDKDAI